MEEGGDLRLSRILRNKALLIFLSVLFLISVNISIAQTKGVFYEIRSSSNIIYLLGSIHLGNEGMYPIRDEIEDAFERSDFLVVEADILDLSSLLKVQKAINLKGMYPKGDSIKNHISAETYNMLEEYFSPQVLKTLEMFKPWVFLFLISPKDIDLNPQYGVDLYFLKKAKSIKKPIIELEGIYFQIDLFSGFPEDLLETYLKLSLLEVVKDKYKQKYEEMIDAYIKGDEEKLWEVVIKDYVEKSEYRYLYEKLFVERNVNMAEKIKEFLKDNKTYFVIVGAGHLIGADSVIEILKKEGFEVRRVFDD